MLLLSVLLLVLVVLLLPLLLLLHVRAGWVTFQRYTCTDVAIVAAFCSKNNDQWPAVVTPNWPQYHVKAVVALHVGTNLHLLLEKILAAVVFYHCHRQLLTVKQQHPVCVFLIAGGATVHCCNSMRTTESSTNSNSGSDSNSSTE